MGTSRMDGRVRPGGNPARGFHLKGGNPARGFHLKKGETPHSLACKFDKRWKPRAGFPLQIGGNPARGFHLNIFW